LPIFGGFGCEFEANVGVSGKNGGASAVGPGEQVYGVFSDVDRRKRGDYERADVEWVDVVHAVAVQG
jgi:hypothetical protein